MLQIAIVVHSCKHLVPLVKKTPAPIAVNILNLIVFGEDSHLKGKKVDNLAKS